MVLVGEVLFLYIFQVLLYTRPNGFLFIEYLSVYVFVWMLMLKCWNICRGYIDNRTHVQYVNRTHKN